MSTMRRMIEKGEAAVEAASDQDADALAGMSEEVAHSERETFLCDAITNIHHYADHYGLDWKKALDEFHYQAEKGTPPDEQQEKSTSGSAPERQDDVWPSRQEIAMSDYRQFDAQQQKEALALLESLPWGDMDMQIYDFEEALRRAIEATRFDLLKWEVEAEAVGLPDEFSLSPEVVADLSQEWRLAYVARLLRTLAMRYGVSTGRMPVWDEDKDSPAGLLRGLNDLLWLGTLGGGNSESDRRERETQDDP